MNSSGNDSSQTALFLAAESSIPTTRRADVAMNSALLDEQMRWMGDSSAVAELLADLREDPCAVRLFLPVLAATVWSVIGWRSPPWCPCSAPRLLTCLEGRRAFNGVAWPALAVLIATGDGHVLVVRDHGLRYRTTLIVELLLVIASDIGALLHAWPRTTAGLAVRGAVTVLGSVGALFVGVLPAG